MKGKPELLELLKHLDINYISYSHKPIYNVNDAEIYAKEIKGAHCKNLFLKDARGKFYLVITLDRKRVDIKKLPKYANSKRLSFAPKEFLEEYLGVEPGSVTPFALMNDYKKEITVLLDDELLKEESVSFHPLVNTETLNIRLADLFKFIVHCGQSRIIIKNLIE